MNRELGWSNRFRYMVIALLMIAAGLMYYYMRSAVKPLIIGGLLAYLLTPAVNLIQQKTRWRRSLVVNLVFWVSIALVISLPALLFPALISEIETIGRDLQDFYGSLQDMLSRPVLIMGWELDKLVPLPEPDELPGFDVRMITEGALYIIEAVTENVLWLLVILATTFFLLKDWDIFRDFLIGLAPKEYQGDVRRLHEQIKVVWRGYLRGNFLLMLIVWIVFSLAWVAVGLPAALFLGILAGILTIIPDIGPAIAAGVAILVAYVEGSSYLPVSNFWFALLVFAIYMVLINIKNIWVRPKLFARSVHMHEGVVFIAIMVAVLIEGILGALVVVPVLASAEVIGRYILRRLYKLDPFPEDKATAEN